VLQVSQSKALREKRGPNKDDVDKHFGIDCCTRYVLAIKKFPRHSLNPKINFCIHKSRQWSISWSGWVLSTLSDHIFLRFILILSTHQSLGLSCGLFRSSSTTIFTRFYFPHISPISSSSWIMFGESAYCEAPYMQFSLVSRHIISFISKRSRMHPTVNTLNLCFP
jgi:hypothetical protein